MEITVCHCGGCTHLGHFLAMPKDIIQLWLLISGRKAPEIMSLVRLLYFCAAHYNINICVQHIPGTSNEIADAISHFQDVRFNELVPKANAMLVGLRLICRHNLRNNRYHFIRELFWNNRSLMSIKFIKRSSSHAIDYSAY